MATTLWNRWTEERKAKKHHTTTCGCRQEFTPGEYYAREAIPPWVNGQGYWMVFVYCTECRRY